MLYIYRASAGSGKTHLLTGFFIRLLFRPELMPEDLHRAAYFDEILAVTFTNKATAEMKERIVQELHRLATEPQKSDYWTDINPDGRLTPHAAARMARRILASILGDYSSFQISTIDAFFQRIVRAFARELNVQGNYEVELNSDRVLDAAVAQLLTDLDMQGDASLFDWLVEFARGRIDEGKGWDLKGELRQLANELTKEHYRSHAESIEAFTRDKRRLGAYVAGLRRTKGAFESRLRRLGEDGLEVLNRYGLDPTSFKGGSHSPLLRFAKWAKGNTSEPPPTFLPWAESQDEWYAKGATDRIGGEAAAALQEVIRALIAHFDGPGFTDYLTARAILPHIYQLGLLADIDRCARRLCAEQGIMLLASTTELLRRLIGTGDAPFIYEKTGTRIKAYMIDEFQDTSAMQWDNFRPLLADSLAAGNTNLIVGDVKQSIYRWRGSDWSLLQSGLDAFMPDMHINNNDALRTNYRSARTVVHFNNDFFTATAQRLGLADVYADVAQRVAPARLNGAPGLVALCRTPGTGKADEQLAASIAALPDVVIRLQQAGFRARDIAILCRKGKVCAMAAEALLAYRKQHPDSPYTFDIISNEALTLASRATVQAVVALMQYLRNPRSALLRAVAACSLYHGAGVPVTKALRRPLPDGLDALGHRPLYEMTEGLIAIVEACRPDDAAREAPFLQALRDVLMDFVSRKSADLSAFLGWWDDHGAALTIATPDTQDAIHITTVHKAKGLAWPAVILPHAAWDIELRPHNDDLFWVETEVGDLPTDDGAAAPATITLPVALKNAALPSTHFAAQYADECRRALIDNLNTAYVAFTRPREALVILTPDRSATSQGDGKAKVRKASDPAAPKKPTLDVLLADYAADPDHGFRAERLQATVPVEAAGATAEAPQLDLLVLGEWQRSQPAGAAATTEGSAPAAPTSPTAEAPTPAPTPRRMGLPRLSLRRSERLAHDAAIDRGNRIHDALARVTTADDVADPDLRRLLAHPDVAAWFAPGLTVLNERSILTPDGDTYRPDRIVSDAQGRLTVIDYKTGHPTPAHRQQVGRYMDLLRAMGYTDVAGFIWYLEPHRVVAC